MSQPPPISPWGHVWRYLLTLTISGLAWFELAAHQWAEARTWFWIDASLGVAALVLVAWRRRFPVAVALLTNAVCAVSGAAGGPATLALFSLATRRRWTEIVPVGLVGLAAGLVLIVISPSASEPAVVITTAVVAVIGVTIGWGMFVGSRRELLAALRERADTAEVEQAARVAQARTAERSRIAREMHDVLAHRISLVTMHAGALEYRADLSPEQVRETAGIIRESSHQALVDLREVLGVLREDPGDAVPERPQPDARDVPCLLQEARDSGMHVLDDLSGVDLDQVPAGAGRTAYRTVQEGLTNARKHAPDTLVTVTLSGGPGLGLVVEVRNPLRVGEAPTLPASGLGLIGLAERAALSGGTLQHGLGSDRVFVLRASLPWAT